MSSSLNLLHARQPVVAKSPVPMTDFQQHVNCCRLVHGQVESFALALNFGGYFAIPCGLMYDWLEPYDRLAPMCAGVGSVPCICLCPGRSWKGAK